MFFFLVFGNFVGVDFFFGRGVVFFVIDIEKCNNLISPIHLGGFKYFTSDFKAVALL